VIIRAVNLANPAGSTGWRRHELLIDAVPGTAEGQLAKARPCQTDGAASTAVLAPEHPEASVTVVGVAGSTLRKPRPSGEGSAI
jgi:hypothetical protein